MSDTIFNSFGLRENPFRINPDPRFLFVTEQTRATGDELIYAIRTRKGLILLTGEVGTGKTMLIRRLLDWLAEQKMPTAFIFNSHIKSEHLIDFILNDFGVPCTSSLKSEKLLALQAWLLERYRDGQTPVLIVDEAQGLEPTTLEEIRLLLNFETPREKLLQILLAGQPELEIKLKRHELRQLRQRITIRCRTTPLTLEQTYGYIHERLRVAGSNGRAIFSPDAIASVHAYSHGIPRVINVLCEHSLINACAEAAGNVSPGMVEQAAQDCQLDRADSVARILNTASYSTAGLSDIGSILAAISAGSDSSVEPLAQRQFPEALPQVNASYPQAQASTLKQPPAPGPITRDLLSGTSTPRQAVSSAQPLPRLEASLPLPHQAFPATEVALPQSEPEIPSAPPRTPRPSPSNFLQHWRRSFAADVRASYRQFRRAIHSLQVHGWRPFAGNLSRELHSLRTRASRLVSDPRWPQLRTRIVATSKVSWDNLKSATNRGLHHYFKQETTQKRDRGASPRANRRRAILSLRRWLHEPISTQRKVTRVHHRRS